MDTIEITLTTPAYGGECLGRLPDGRAAFVPYSLPDEHVCIRILEEKRGYVRAELVEVLTPSAKRLTPRCPHYFSPGTQQSASCGGCHYQHIPYDVQLLAKSTILSDQLKRIGHIAEPHLQSMVACPQPWNYRNHIQFHISPEGKLGFETNKAKTNITIPIQECHLPEEILNHIWPQLDLEPIPGLKRVGLRLGSREDVMLILESAEPFEFNVEDLPISAVQVGPGGSMVLAGSDYLFMEILGKQFRVSAKSFFQVNNSVATAMVEHILDNISISPVMTLVDVYCGVGLFSTFLAPYVKKLIGIELSPTACDDFAFNLDDFDNVDLYQAAAEDVMPMLDIHPDVIIVDPPRAGLAPRARQAIVDLQAPHLVYISCNPATLARDAHHLLKGGYHLEQITPFDLFPQTYHIESISFWEL